MNNIYSITYECSSITNISYRQSQRQKNNRSFDCNNSNRGGANGGCVRGGKRGGGRGGGNNGNSGNNGYNGNNANNANNSNNGNNSGAVPMAVLEQKHPVSLLGELGKNSINLQ